MKKVLEAFWKSSDSPHPIVNLLRIRSDPSYVLPSHVAEFRSDPKFRDLPAFTAKQIAKCEADLDKNISFCDSLRGLPFMMEYSHEFVSDLSNTSELGEPEQIEFLYECVSWILADKIAVGGDEQILLSLLNRCSEGPFGAFCGQIFREVVDFALKTENTKVLELIIQHFCVNRQLGEGYSGLFRSVFDRVMAMQNEELCGKILAMIVVLFEDERPGVLLPCFTHILSNITDLFNAVNYDAVLIVAYASNYSDEMIIVDSFVVLPTLILNKLEKVPVELDPDVRETEAPAVTSENGVTFEGDLIEVCGAPIREMSAQLNSVIATARAEVLEGFLISLSKMSEALVDSMHGADFIVLISLILEELSRKVSIKPLLPLIFKSCVFNPDVTIFSQQKISEKLTTVRNGIIDVIANVNAGLFYDIFEMISRSPFLAAELVMKLSFKLGKTFFVAEGFLGSLFNAINLLRQKRSAVTGDDEPRARSVLMSTMFTILEDSKMTILCFTDVTYSMSFVNLTFDEDFSRTTVDFLTSCLSKFEILPDGFVQFLSVLLSTCAANSDSTHFGELGTRLIKGINQALSHNPHHGVAFAGLFGSCLKFCETTKTKEDFDLVMTMFTLVTQSKKELALTDDVFDAILEIRKTVEGDDPSESFVLACLNLMNASTNLGLDHLFSVENTDVVPLLFCSYCSSTKVTECLDLFQRLCSFSFSNTIAFHNGKLDVIILEAIRGEFSFRNKTMRFNFMKDSIDPALRLVSTIVSVRSSVEVDGKFLRLLESHDIDVSKPALMTLHELFSNHKGVNHEIWSPYPIYELSGTFGKELQRGFAFSCYIKVDPSAGSQNENIIICMIEDTSKRVMKLVFHKETLMWKYDALNRRTSASLMQKLPVNKWILITTFIAVVDGETVVVFRAGDDCSDDITFRDLQFDENVKLSFGMTEKGTIGPNSFSPVAIGEFAMFFAPFDDPEFELLHANGFSELPNMSNVIFSSNSPNCKLNLTMCKTEMSITSLMPEHARIADFKNIFANHDCHKDALFVEVALSTLRQCTDFHNSCNSGKAFVSLIEDDQSPFPFLTEVTGISDDIFKEYSSASSPFKFSMHLSEISIIISHIMHSDRFRIDSSLFPPFLEMIEATPDEELKLEIMENAIINIWIWASSNPSHLQKVSRQLTNYLSQFIFPEECELFTECLVQCHLLQNHSTVDIPGLQEVKMKLLSLLPLKEKDLPCLVAVILSLKDPVQIADYLDLLLQRGIQIPLDLLVELTDIVEYSDFEQASRIVTLVTASAGERSTELQVCLVQIALKAKAMEIFQLIQCELDIFCIEALRTNSTTRLEQLIRSLLSECATFWYFWPLLVVFYVNESVLDFIIGNIIRLGAQMLPSQYTGILNLLAILRATRAFTNVRRITKRIVCEILDFVIANKEKFSRLAIRQIILRSFASVFCKMRWNSHSTALLKLWQESPYADGETMSDPRPKLDSTFSYENLQKMFGSFLQNMHFRFWQSHSKRPDPDITKRILALIESVCQDFASDRTVILIAIILKEKTDVITRNEVFDFFVSGMDSVEILTQQMKTALTEFNLYLNPKLKSEFNRHQVLTCYYNSEKLRLKRLYQCVDYEDMIGSGLSCRFVRFPLQTHERSKWVVDEDYTFSMLKSHESVNKVTLVHSAPCKMVTILGRINVTFVLLSNEFRISQIGKPVISIKFDTVNVILAVMPKYIEIYTSACQSTLLCFSREQYRCVLEKLKTFPLKVIRGSDEGKAQIADLWRESKISIMDLILGLNFMSGRSFNDIYYYPIAPIILNNKFFSTFHLVDNQKYITAVSRWLFTLNLMKSESLPASDFSPYDEAMSAIKSPGCIPPQIYYSFYSFESGLHRDIYLARKSMESNPEIGKKTCDWVETQFGVTLSHKDPVMNSSDVILQSVIRHNKTIVKASFFSKSTDIFFMQFDDMTIEIYSLNLTSVIPTMNVVRRFRECPSFTDFCALASQLLLFDWDNCLLYRVNDLSLGDKVVVSLPITCIVPHGDSAVFVIDHNLVCIAPGQTFPFNRKTICAELEHILFLQTSVPFQIVVYVTAQQEMKIVSIFSSRVIGTLKFEDEIVQKILISDTWGFIIVKTDKHMYTCSVNGDILSAIDFTPAVLHWITHWDKGCEFLILIDDQSRLMSCEAFFLNTLKEINKLKKSIAVMKASTQRDTIILITTDSKLILLPLQF